MLDILRLGIDFSLCEPSWRIENPWFLLAIKASQWRNVLLILAFLKLDLVILYFFDGIFSRFVMHSMADLQYGAILI